MTSRKLRTHQIIVKPKESKADDDEKTFPRINWYTNQNSINLSITNRGKWSDITLSADILKKFIASMQEAHEDIMRCQSVPIWYKGATIGTALPENGIYTFYAAIEDLPNDAQEFARREIEMMNHTARQIL